MMSFCKKNAAYSKGILTVHAANSKSAGVVRVDLNAMPMAHFQVHSNADGSVLGYMDGAARFTPLAVFTERADADKVLTSIQRVLMQPGIVTRLLRILLLLGVIFIVAAFIQDVIAYIRTNPAPAAAVSAPAPQAGVPMDADSRFESTPQPQQ